MNTWNRVECIEIKEIISTSDRCVIARCKDTGKPINLPRSITEFYPGRAIVPAWFARKVMEPAGTRR